MRMLLLLIATIAVALSPASAVAEARIALVIGNGAYTTGGALDNPPNDARLVGSALEGAGFDVTYLIDADEDRMEDAIRDFGSALRRAPEGTVALFYFAGHGVQTGGRNFLIPVGASVRDEADLEGEAVAADWVLRQMESAGTTNIMILDACRDNPFATSFRSSSRGLAQMGAPTGSFIAYATAPGDVAYDGRGRNSPYSAALARGIRTPGVPIESLFKRVRREVLAETDNGQTPWESSSLIDDFVFLPAGDVAGSVDVSSNVVPLPRAEAPTASDGAGAGSTADAADGDTRAKGVPLTGGDGILLGSGDGGRADAPRGDPGLLRLDVTLDYRKNCALGRFRDIDVSLAPGAGYSRHRGKTLRGDPVIEVKAARAGAGAVLEIVILAAQGVRSRTIEVTLDRLEPGTSEEVFTTVRDPSRAGCGNVTAYVVVAG
ncbi:MAG: caspase family protein [Pseudomonadota bacterium]